MVDTSVSLAQQSSPCIFVTPSQHNCGNDAVQEMSADVNYPLTELKSAKGPTLYSCCTQPVSSCSPRPPEVVVKAQQPAQHNIQACYPAVHDCESLHVYKIYTSNCCGLVIICVIARTSSKLRAFNHTLHKLFVTIVGA
jgi:hypothetical protein